MPTVVKFANSAICHFPTPDSAIGCAMEAPTRFRITRCLSQTVEIANIVTISREEAKIQIDAVWWTGLENALHDPDDEPDSHWEWSTLLSKSQNRPYFRAVGVQTDDAKIQAAMLFRVDARSALQTGQMAVFIDRLAAAPWNRKNLVPAPVYRGGCEALLAYSVAISHSLGFSGRVNLFPVANETFYSGRGFVPTSVIVEGETLFELPADAARAILEKRGLLNG